MNHLSSGDIEELADRSLEISRTGDSFLDALYAPPEYVYYRFLYSLARALQPEIMVELGVCAGQGSAHLAAGNPSGRVLSIDPELHGGFADNTQPYTNIEFIQTRSDDPALLSRIADHSIGLLFIDSVHAKDYVLREYTLWRPKMKPGGLILFDDLNLNPGMREVLPSLPEAVKGLLPGLHADFGFGYVLVEQK